MICNRWSFSSGVRKPAYLLGRFLPALTVSAIVTSGYIIGFLIARSMPYIDPSYFQEDTLLHYVGPLLVKTLPNALILGGLFFALNLIFRHQLVNWVAIILLYLVTLAALRIQDPDLQPLAFLIDPLGLDVSVAGRGISRTSYEADAYLIGNRLLWMTLSLIAAGLSAWRFQLSEEQKGLRLFRRNRPATIADSPQTVTAAARGLKAALIRVDSSGMKQVIAVWLGSLRFRAALYSFQPLLPAHLCRAVHSISSGSRNL